MCGFEDLKMIFKFSNYQILKLSYGWNLHTCAVLQTSLSLL